MHFYQHNIADYRKDTGHLTLLEHGIYRQLLDQYYLEENALRDINKIMRLLCVRNANEQEALKNVLNDFFELTENGYKHLRCEKELEAIYSKSAKARKSAQKRWGDTKQQVTDKNDANAMLEECERIPKAMLPITHNPLPQDNIIKNNIIGKNKKTNFKKPGIDEIKNYCAERKNNVNPLRFFDFYEMKDWMVGKNKMKDWKAAIRTWEQNSDNHPVKTTSTDWKDNPNYSPKEFPHG